MSHVSTSSRLDSSGVETPLGIEVKDLSKSYKGRQAVRAVSFSVREGEIFGLLGPNGAGKTTTLLMLSTLIEADSGEIKVGGRDLRRQVSEIKAMIGIVPQELALYWSLSGRQNLKFFGRIYGLKGKVLAERCDEVLEVVGLSERADDAVKTYSGGMRRRLNMAVALVHEPRILLLDEPTVGVDPQSRSFIFAFVERLRSKNTAIIYTTHYMEEAERLCDRVAIMDEGRILAAETPGGLIRKYGRGILRVEFQAGLEAQDTAMLANLPHVVECEGDSCVFNLRTLDAQSALLELIELCRGQGLGITALEVLSPSLETVFLQLTGRRLRG